MSLAHKKIVALILASGESKRFKANKVLAKPTERSLIELALAHLEPLFPDNIVITLGRDHQNVAMQLGEHHTTFCPDYKKGIGHSIAWGTQSVINEYDDCEAILIALADQPEVNTEDYSRLIKKFDECQGLVAASYADTVGVPAIFPKSMFADLLALRGDEGAKRILLRHTNQLTKVEMGNAAFDIDTPEDLENYRRRIKDM